MIAPVLAWQVAMKTDITVTYRHVPGAVVTVGAYTFADAGRPVPVGTQIVRSNDVLRISIPGGRRFVILFTRHDGAYLLDGPFVAESAAERPLPAIWRRTVFVSVPPDMDDRSELTWMPAEATAVDDWPRCARSEKRVVECWGVPLGAHGILLSVQAARTWWTVVTGPTPQAFQPSSWARLLRVHDRDANDPLTITVAHAVAPPQRQRTIRVQAARVPNVRTVPVASGAVWVHGEDIPAGAWVEARTARGGPTYLSLDDVARAPPALPLWIALEDSRPLDGIVRGATGEPAAAALVTLFRLIERRSQDVDDREKKPRRVSVGEQVANASGEFHFDALGEADYEIVAWHPQLGRAVAAVSDTGGTFVVRLEAPGHVRGRVLSAGRPLAGVDVISLPDPAAFAAAEDITDVKGGDARTAPDGRFVVVLAPGGGGELRIGGGAVPIRRIPLPRVPVPVIDLGDIDLGMSIEVSIALDRDPGCDLGATGPIGRSGLQVVSGSRVAPSLFRIVFPEEGSWEIHLLCGRDERALAPGVVPITAATAGKEVRLTVR